MDCSDSSLTPLAGTKSPKPTKTKTETKTRRNTTQIRKSNKLTNINLEYTNCSKCNETEISRVEERPFLPIGKEGCTT